MIVLQVISDSELAQVFAEIATLLRFSVEEFLKLYSLYVFDDADAITEDDYNRLPNPNRHIVVRFRDCLLQKGAETFFNQLEEMATVSDILDLI